MIIPQTPLMQRVLNCSLVLKKHHVACVAESPKCQSCNYIATEARKTDSASCAALQIPMLPKPVGKVP